MSTSFRNAALALLREIGINDPPDSYMDDLVALNHACSLCAREMAGESFVFKLPPLPRTDNDAPLYAGSLHRAVRFSADQHFPGNIITAQLIQSILQAFPTLVPNRQ